MARAKPAMDDTAALRLIVEGTVDQTGAEFFRALVRNMAAVLGTAGAWVTEYLPETKRLRAHAFWLKDSFVEDYEYDIAGTACAQVIGEQRLVHVPDRVIELYPDDTDLKPIGAVSYLGLPLLDTDGTVMGHLALLDTKPLKAEPRVMSLFEIFAARAAAEQRRMRKEMDVRARDEQLDALLSAAMDAILVLDESYCIVRVNPAAERLFGFDAKALAGARLRDLLDSESAAHLPTLVHELEQQPDAERQLWIPRHLNAMTANGTAFPAEATLSCFKLHGRRFHALIMRSVNDRIEAERRIQLLLEETEYLRASAGIGEMLGRSPAIRQVFTALKRVASTDATVLVTGETGTGKELIARALHEGSPRKGNPLVRVNCAAIPGTLMESEFFGHERGAFTGATARREGRFALADGGTLFLDEVGELPLDLQAKLLRVLQEGEFEPLGSTRTRKVNVRVIAATNCDLAAMAAGGKFREDLYYRLNVFPVRVPPLRERGADVALLAQAFVDRLARRMGRRMDPLHPDDFRLLQDYPWPGNVRELQNVVERAIILSAGSRLDLRRAMPESANGPPTSITAPVTPLSDKDGTEKIRILTAAEIEAMEKANIECALEECGGKIAGDNGAAQRLGLAPSTLNSRLKALGIARKA